VICGKNKRRDSSKDLMERVWLQIWWNLDENQRDLTHVGISM